MTHQTIDLQQLLGHASEIGFAPRFHWTLDDAHWNVYTRREDDSLSALYVGNQQDVLSARSQLTGTEETTARTLLERIDGARKATEAMEEYRLTAYTISSVTGAILGSVLAKSKLGAAVGSVVVSSVGTHLYEGVDALAQVYREAVEEHHDVKYGHEVAMHVASMKNNSGE